MAGRESSGEKAMPRKREPKKARGVYEYPRRSGRWWIQLFYGGRRHREYAGTREMAVDLLAKKRLARLRSDKLPESIRRAPVTFVDIAKAGLDWSREHKASHDGDACRLAHVAKMLGTRPAGDIKPRELEQALLKLKEANDWKPATVNRVKSVVSMCYRIAVQNGVVDTNPARLVRQLRAENTRLRFLSAEEESRLRAVIAANCPQHMPELDIALHTGMRASEQYGLTWDVVDLEQRQLHLAHTKNGRERHIPLNPVACEALWALRRLSAGVGPVFVNAVTPGRYRGLPRHTARNWFEQCVERAGVAQFTWHCLRHTFASRLVMAGVDIRTVAELLGHRTLAMTMRYAHLTPAHQADAVERLATAAVQSGRQTATRTATEVFGVAEEVPQVGRIQ